MSTKTTNGITPQRLEAMENRSKLFTRHGLKIPGHGHPESFEEMLKADFRDATAALRRVWNLANGDWSAPIWRPGHDALVAALENKP